MTEQSITAYMPDGLPFTFHVYGEVDSTNTLAREYAKNGGEEGAVFLADAQRKGRGRIGRSFFSPSATGLYMSLVLRPAADVDPLSVTTAAAVAVALSVEELVGVSASIKWVNDVYCRGRKVCGILTEGAISAATQSTEFAVLGIGVNLTEPTEGFPSDIRARAGAVFDAKTPLPHHAKEKLATAILTRFWGYYSALTDTTWLEEYRRRDYLRGKRVDVLDVNGNTVETVTALGVTDTFELRVCDENGHERCLSSGDVSIRL